MSGVIVVVYVVIGLAVLVAIVMSFFVRRHGEAAPGDSPLQRTDEVFIDPTTKRRMRVWVDPVSGDRQYREEG